ncbi:nuclear transport factor 2 family protein [Muricauda sp. CAU 1633]|uniref:nuclear transport factor 2 family protein n=1 Tax=Allomuricauda sp. CAU 1633 TaxID=2816036 RepID=UPI001A8C3F11|nr:nuclear transport factor 2 family protein [Muricauda sp. CAU 1633]MBO0320759.1 nuclear transport factor 2 family protein [Muricauda sp. CAU 1633]
MKSLFVPFIMVFLLLFSCQNPQKKIQGENTSSKDSIQLVQMILDREKAMVQKDMGLAMARFTEDATWINSQGYYFEGKHELQKFHNMMMHNDSMDYYYEVGKPKIRVLSSQSALAYYSWKMFWYKKEIPTDTTYKEIGFMTLTAQKNGGIWKWTAVTNQHTPWFYPEINPVVAE